MKKLLCIASFLLGLLPSLAFAQYAALPTTGTLSGLQAVTDINTNFSAVFAAAPCGDSTHALGATTTSFTCQTLSGGGSSTLAVTTSAVNYSGVMAAVTSGSLSTVYSAAGYTYNASTKAFNIGSGGTYGVNGTQITCSNLSNGATGCSTATGTSGATLPLLNGANTWSGVQTYGAGDLALNGTSTGVVVTNGSGVASVQTTLNATYLSLATSTADGIVKPDNSTITISGGVISAPGSGGGTVNSGVANAIGFYSSGGTAISGTTTNDASISTGAMTLGSTGVAGSLTFGNATSGTVKIQPVTGALGTVTLSLPAATDTLVGAATTNTLTNKTFDTAGTGNTFDINGTAISAVSGTGAVALVGSPTFTGTVGAAAIAATGVVTGGAFVAPPDTLTISTATFTPVAVGSNTYRVVLVHASCPCTIANPSGSAVDGQKFILELWQSSTGSDTIGTWGTNYDFGTVGSPTLSTGASKGDFLGFSYSSQNSKYNYIGIQQGM